MIFNPRAKVKTKVFATMGRTELSKYNKKINILELYTFHNMLFDSCLFIFDVKIRTTSTYISFMLLMFGAKFVS